MYIPKHVLRNGVNTIILLEQDGSPCRNIKSCKITLQDFPEINGPTPTSYDEK